jgi:hypothetical protein
MLHYQEDKSHEPNPKKTLVISSEVRNPSTSSGQAPLFAAAAPQPDIDQHFFARSP